MPLLQATSHLLRGRPVSRRWMLTLAGVSSMLYGAAMGSYAGIDDGRWMQVILSALKLPALGAISFLVALPSFIVFNLLLGVGQDMGEVTRLLLRSQAVLAVVLVALAPLTLLWYASVTDYQTAVLGNGVFIGLATVTAQFTLSRDYRPLVARRPVHRKLRWMWLGLFSFVAIQLAWVLRPFIGDPNGPVQFLREDAWGNAYVIIARLVWRTLSG